MQISNLIIYTKYLSNFCVCTSLSLWGNIISTTNTLNSIKTNPWKPTQKARLPLAKKVWNGKLSETKITRTFLLRKNVIVATLSTDQHTEIDPVFFWGWEINFLSQKKENRKDIKYASKRPKNSKQNDNIFFSDTMILKNKQIFETWMELTVLLLPVYTGYTIMRR